jgi:hypothetical protein
VTNPSFDSDFSYPESIQQYPRSLEILGWSVDRARIWQDQSTKPDGFGSSSPDANSRQRTVEICRTVRRRHGQVNLLNNTMSGTTGSNKTTAGCIVTTDAERAIKDKSKCARYAANVRHANAKRLREEGMGSNSAESGGVESRFGDEKKRYREKNRLAAARCREKKKGNTEDIVMKHHLCARPPGLQLSDYAVQYQSGKNIRSSRGADAFNGGERKWRRVSIHPANARWRRYTVYTEHPPFS